MPKQQKKSIDTINAAMVVVIVINLAIVSVALFNQFRNTAPANPEEINSADQDAAELEQSQSDKLPE